MDKNINSFTFFRDYFNLIDTLKKTDKLEVLNAIVNYMFKDEEPTLKGHNLAVFNTLKHQLNKSKSNSKRSKGNGAPIGNNNASKNKPKTNQKQTENKPNEEPKTNKSRLSTFYFLISNFLFLKLIDKYSSEDIEKLKESIKKWYEYKLERKEEYKERGFNALLTQIENNVLKYGLKEVCDLIEECMASNYKGIIFDKLEKTKPKEFLTYQERKNKEYEEMKKRFLAGGKENE